MATAGFFKVELLVEHIQINDRNLLYNSDLCMPEFPLPGNILFYPTYLNLSSQNE